MQVLGFKIPCLNFMRYLVFFEAHLKRDFDYRSIKGINLLTARDFPKKEHFTWLSNVYKKKLQVQSLHPQKVVPVNQK